MTLFYPNSANTAISVLLNRYNLINVYVEDSTIARAHFHLVNRAINDIGSISYVFPVGDREQVIEKAKHDHDPKSIYLIDGDLSTIYFKGTKSKKNIYQLSCYCVENVVAETDAIVETTLDYSPSMTASDVVRMINGGEPIREKRFLVRLFCLYAIAHFKNTGVPTVQFSMHRLMRRLPSGDMDWKKCNERFRKILKAVYARIGRNGYLMEKKKILDNISSKNLSWAQIVSGKHYMIPLIHRRCRSAGYTASEQVFIIHLARHCTFVNEPKFRLRLRKHALRAKRSP